MFLVFASCGENSEDLQHEKIDNDSLILMSMEIFEDSDQSLPNQKLTFTISLDEDGKAIVRFSAEDKSPSEVQNLRSVVQVSNLEGERVESSMPVEILDKS